MGSIRKKSNIAIAILEKLPFLGRGENRELIPAGVDGEFPLLRQFRG